VLKVTVTTLGRNTLLISIRPSVRLTVKRLRQNLEFGNLTSGRMKYPSRDPPVIPGYYAACHFPETMPDVVDTNNPIQGMLSHAAMMSSSKKAQRLGVYETDPITVDD
jgi:hypothetical protein